MFKTKPTLISVIVPCFNESANIGPFYSALQAATKDLGYNFELIFVDDGSTDDTVKAIQTLSVKGPLVRVVELVRNFGKEVATTAGLHRALGEAAIIIDADLQHPPKYIPEFIAKWREGAEVVVGVRTTSTEHATRLKRLSSTWYYRIMRTISDTDLTPGSTDYRLVDRMVIDEFNRFTERNRLTRGLIDWLGFTRAYVYFEPCKRLNGEAAYGYRKLFKLAINSVVSTSLLPLKLAGYLGGFITLLTLPLGIFIIIEKYLLHDPWNLNITGTAQLAIMLLFLVGIILICLGLIALYVASIYGEVVNRPLYVVRRRRKQ